MKKYNKLFIVYFILVGLIVFGCKDISMVAMDNSNLNYVACGSATGIPRPIPQLTTVAYTLLITATPLILIIFSIITLFKAVSFGTSEDVEKAKKGVIKKFIIAAIIFFIGAIVHFAINKVTSNDEDKKSAASCIKCFLYYSKGNCPASSADMDYTTKRTKKPNTSNYTNSNIVRSSNKSSNKTSSSTTGSFTEEEMKKISLQILSFEGGIDPQTKQFNYGNYGECYALSPSETSITIGAGGWMGSTAKNLLKEIQKKYPGTFNLYDTAHIADDLNNANWSAYCEKKTSEKGKAIIAIITSTDGKKVQDAMIVADVKNYIEEANKRGVTDKKAVVMYIDVRHVFGGGNLERDLLAKANKPYTADSLYEVIMRDFIAKGTSNEQGYINRHNAFKKFADENF